jgi:hypothetical protein
MPHEILAPIVKRGEMDKARDTRPESHRRAQVSDAKLSEQFEREARAIGALNPVSRRIQ